MTLLVDYRERRLGEVLDVPHLVRNLAVGDLLCDYCAGNQWIAEQQRPIEHRSLERPAPPSDGNRLPRHLHSRRRPPSDDDQLRQLAWRGYQRRAAQGFLRDQNSRPARDCRGRSDTTLCVQEGARLREDGVLDPDANVRADSLGEDREEIA